MEKKLGRIKKANFGQGGYQDAMIGVTFHLEGEGWGVGDFWGDWSCARTTNTQWTEESRIRRLGETCMRLNNILVAAKKANVAELAGVPIEVTFDGNKLESWRILTEVL